MADPAVEELLHNALENAENEETRYWIRTALQRLMTDACTEDVMG